MNHDRTYLNHCTLHASYTPYTPYPATMPVALKSPRQAPLMLETRTAPVPRLSLSGSAWQQVASASNSPYASAADAAAAAAHKRKGERARARLPEGGREGARRGEEPGHRVERGSRAERRDTGRAATAFEGEAGEGMEGGGGGGRGGAATRMGVVGLGSPSLASNLAVKGKSPSSGQVIGGEGLGRSGRGSKREGLRGVLYEREGWMGVLMTMSVMVWRECFCVLVYLLDTCVCECICLSVCTSLHVCL